MVSSSAPCVAALLVDDTKRGFEYKKLAEMELVWMLLKIDAVDTSGDEGAQACRKEIRVPVPCC